MANEKTEDRRVRRTKNNLRENLFNLLDKKSINQITVTELTNLADINRSTFYLYYTDIYDMIDKIHDDIYDEFMDKVVRYMSTFEEPEDFIEYLARYLQFCKENYAICKFITRDDCKNQLASKIQNAILTVIPDTAKTYGKSDPRHYLTNFALSGMLSVIIEWMNDGMKIEPIDMARFLGYTYVLGAKMQKEGDLYKQYTKENSNLNKESELRTTLSTARWNY